MSKLATLHLKHQTLADMREFAKDVASQLRPGVVIGLTGELGAGKTTLARFIIQHLCGDNIEVPSPTYSLIQIYECDGFDLWHGDMYRLDRPEDSFELGLQDAFETECCLIEWPDKLGQLWPDTAANIHIEFDQPPADTIPPDTARASDTRRITFSGF